MPEIDKKLLRLASAVHSELNTHKSRELVELPTTCWNSCAELVRQNLIYHVLPEYPTSKRYRPTSRCMVRL